LKIPFVSFDVPEASGDMKRTAGSVPIMQNTDKSNIYGRSNSLTVILQT
jgi:hypothetical protein